MASDERRTVPNLKSWHNWGTVFVSGLAAAKQTGPIIQASLLMPRSWTTWKLMPKHFDVLRCVRSNSKVVEIRFIGDRKITDNGGRIWEFVARSIGLGGCCANRFRHIQWHAFEFLVMCIGKYGDIPKMPVFPKGKGPDVFQGKVMHSMDYSKLDQEAATQLLRGKKVVVVGYKKSAIDLAMECAEANQGNSRKDVSGSDRSYLEAFYYLHIFDTRTGRTTVHDDREDTALDSAALLVWGLPFFLFYSTRFAQFLHERPNQSLLKTLLCLLFTPLRRGVSKFIESYLLWKMPLEKHGLKPEHPFEEDYASCQMAIVPENFFGEAEKGKIVFKRPSKWWFWEGGIEFDDKTRVEADAVALATGFESKQKIKSILPEPFRSVVEFPSGIMPLYRGIIHPLIPNMAFVGYLESVSNLHSAELGCKWLSRLAEGEFKLPTMEGMLEKTGRELEVSKRTTRFYRRHCISTYSINHDDEICEEMRWTAWRKKNWFFEAFSPYTSQDYEKEK
ncbi:Flavin-containing monooxygenase [Psidium guajava]|nr:Flavin-containing monooxygenase [Psidium guajava]